MKIKKTGAGLDAVVRVLVECSRHAGSFLMIFIGNILQPEVR